MPIELNELPNEVLLRIASFLTPKALLQTQSVSQDWQKLSLMQWPQQTKKYFPYLKKDETVDDKAIFENEYKIYIEYLKYFAAEQAHMAAEHAENAEDIEDENEVLTCDYEVVKPYILHAMIGELPAPTALNEINNNFLKVLAASTLSYDVDALTDFQKRMAAFFALRAKNIVAVKKLLGALTIHADAINIKEKLLPWAVEYDAGISMIEYFIDELNKDLDLKYKDNPENNHGISEECLQAAFEYAGLCGSLAKLEFLLNKVGHVHVAYALYGAAQEGHVHLIQYLINSYVQNGVLFNEDLGTALTDAAVCNSFSAVELLIREAGANIPAEYKNDAIIDAAHAGFAEIVEFLLDECADDLLENDPIIIILREARSGGGNTLAMLEDGDANRGLYLQRTVYILALRNGHTKLAAMLNETYHCATDEIINEEFPELVENGCLNAAEFLLNNHREAITDDTIAEAFVGAVVYRQLQAMQFIYERENSIIMLKTLIQTMLVATMYNYVEIFDYLYKKMQSTMSVELKNKIILKGAKYGSKHVVEYALHHFREDITCETFELATTAAINKSQYEMVNFLGKHKRVIYAESNATLTPHLTYMRAQAETDAKKRPNEEPAEKLQENIEYNVKHAKRYEN